MTDLAARVNAALASFDTADARQQVATEDLRTGIPAPVWPDGVFPTAIDTYVTAAARSIGVPAEMVAAPLLSLAGATVGNAVEVVLKRGFRQLPTVWTGVVAPPGTAKSPALQAAQWPIHHLQTKAFEVWRQQHAEYEADLESWQRKKGEERGPKPAPPLLHHYFTSDTTIEALVAMLNHSQGIAVVRDELSGLVGSFDRYRGGKGADRQEFLQLWAGAPIKADRKAGTPIFAAHPVVGICGGIQPDILGALHDRHGKRDGLVERFLLCVPDVRPRGWTDDDLDPDLLPPVTEMFRKLRSVRMRVGEHAGSGDRIGVQLSPDARRTWVRWFNDNAEAIEVATGLRRGFTAKLPSQVARIALVLHCLHHPDDPRVMIADATMIDAIAVGEFFRSSLDRVLPLIGDHSRGEPAGLAGRILRIVRTVGAGEVDSWVRRSVILNGLGNVPADSLSDELTSLERRGALERRVVATSTRPSEQWRIARRDGSHYSKDSEDFGSGQPLMEEKQESSE